VSALTQALQASSGAMALAAIAVGVVALVWLASLQRRVRTVSPDIRRLVRNMEGKDVHQVVEALLGNMEFLSTRLGRLQVAHDSLEERLRGTVQGQGLVRYNADGKVGGELSFALALVDGERDGILLTCLHTLDECRLYIRQVQQGTCVHELTEEEAEALAIALKRRQPERAEARRTRRTRWREREVSQTGRDAPTAKRGDGDAE